MISGLEGLIGDGDLWTIYDNATDKPIAYGSLNEILSQLNMTRESFEGLLKEYQKDNREFLVLGKKRSVNIMLNGSGVVRQKWKTSHDTRRKTETGE